MFIPVAGRSNSMAEQKTTLLTKASPAYAMLGVLDEILATDLVLNYGNVGEFEGVYYIPLARLLRILKVDQLKTLEGFCRLLDLKVVKDIEYFLILEKQKLVAARQKFAEDLS